MKPFRPLPADSHLIGEVCPGCQQAFQVGDVVTLVAIGPGADRQSQEKARTGQTYNAVAVPCHWACVTGEG